MPPTYRARIVFVVFAFILASATNCLAETINYTYDDMHRLLGAQYGDGTSVAYVYDNLGNRLIKTTTLPGAPANNPPAAVTNPLPADSGTDIPTAPTLTWTGAEDPDADDAVVYSVYFGTSSALSLVATGVETSYSPGQLQSLTTYYWKVVARDNRNAVTESPLWSFTTTNDAPEASFSVDTTIGWAPLLVIFTDTSQSSDDEIVSWAWDFNDDGVVDSTDRNPAFTYTSGGTQTVRLTVADEHGATGTLALTDYIEVYGDDHVDENTVIHCVTNSTELQDALSVAETNGKNDLIQLVQGIYELSTGGISEFSYNSTEPFRLFIRGGYAPGCVSRDPDPANTILDGGNVYRGYAKAIELVEYTLYTQGSELLSQVLILVDGITINNSNAYYPPLYAETYYGDIVVNNTIMKNNTAELNSEQPAGSGLTFCHSYQVMRFLRGRKGMWDQA